MGSDFPFIFRVVNTVGDNKKKREDIEEDNFFILTFAHLNFCWLLTFTFDLPKACVFVFSY